MSTYKCPNNCKPDCDTPYYYPTCCLPDGAEMGVLIYPDLRLSNRWVDGTAGIPDDYREWYEGHDCLPHCLACGEEITIERG
jgi:hypothetical protein